MANDSVIADMDYFLYKQDIARLAAIGIPYHSFTISWTRIVPFGVEGSPVNTLGLDHYEDVLRTCLENGITPIVTLLHADNPVSSQFNSSGFPDDLLYFAKQVMTRLGDRVPYWVTINEPNINTPTYASNLNVLMGHAKVYHWYKEVLKGTGQLTFKFANNIAIPLDGSNPDDIAAALRYQDFILGIEGNPVYLGEQYPESVVSIVSVQAVC